MQKGTIGAAKIGGSVALLLVATAFSIYLVFPALANLDNTTVILRNPANNTYVRGNITLNATLSGANVSDNATFYYLNSTGYFYIGANQTIGPNNFTFNFNTSILSNGVYSFFVNATNLTGSVANATNGNITVDNLAPTVSITAPTAGQFVKVGSDGYIWINGTIYDNLGMGSANVSLNVTNFAIWSFSGANNTGFTLRNNTAIADGYFAINVGYLDAAGNAGNATRNITVDNIAPVLNFLTPTNNSYVYGTTAQLFQINVTEMNLNPANNVTLNYKINSSVSWYNTTLICYNSTGFANANSGPFTCNTTINMPAAPTFYVEGNVIQYYFNTTDLEGNTGNNGTASAPNTVTLDQTPPTPIVATTNSTNNIIAKGTGINLSVRWTDNYALYNATLSTNETGAWQNKTANYSSPITLSGATDWSNFTWVNASIPAGTVIAWKVYANDQVQPIRNENVSINGTFTIDGIAPTSSGNATSLNSPQTYNLSNNYGFQINWTDNIAVSNATFQLGRPNGLYDTNYTNATTPGVVVMGSTYYINFTQSQLGKAGTYNITWFANDTSNNWNNSATIIYNISQAAAPVVQLLLNETQGNRTYNKSDSVRQYAASSISGLTVTLYNNMSGTLAQINSSTSSVNVTNSTSSLALGMYQVFANISSNENYTANVTGVSYYINLTDNIIPTIIIRNATSQQYLNNTYARNNTVLTLNISVSDNDRFANSFNVSVYINTTFIGNITNTTTDNTVNGTVTIPAGLANGNSFLNVSVSDASGNIAYNTSIMLIVDSINPVLNFPTPTNNSYITGSSAQLFQINLTETNIDSTKNVTLNYKKAGSSWAQKTLACYDAAGTAALASGPFKCNATADTSGFGNGDILQYYFNTTDLAGNTGNNGTASGWLNATIANVIPQYVANVSSPATYANYSSSATYGFQINWTSGGVASLSNITFQLGRPGGALNNYTATQNGSSTYIYNTSQAALGPAGIYNITWYANDTAGNANTTGTYNYQIYNASNIVNVYLNDSTGQYVNMNINTTYGNTTIITATSSGGTVNIYRNETQSLVNGTSPQNESVMFGAGFIVYKVNATGNQNYTDNTTAALGIQYNITIAQASPANFLNLQINGTGANLVTSYPNATNVTGWSNVTGQSNLLFALYRNGANVTLNASSANYNRTEANLLGVGNYTYIYNTTGNANYTSGSVTRVLNITIGTPALGLFINSTASNQTYVYPTVARITGNNTDVGNSGMAYELFRNSTNITATVASNDANLTLAGAVYQLIYNTTGNANYTTGTTSFYLTISKAATNVSLWLNGTQGNVNTYNRYDIANLTAKLNVSGKNVSIYVNGTLLNTSTDSSSRLENTTNLTAYAVYNITAYFVGDENYTTSSQQYNATTITTGPTIRVYNATAQQFLNLTMKKSGDTLILNISASSGIGITTGSLCVVTVGGSASGSISYSSGWCNGTITVPSLATGYRVMNITLNDTNNNTGFNDTFALSIDNAAPVLNLTAPSNLSYVKVNADGFVWINGTAYDNLGMGVTNVTVGGANASLFAVWSFNGTNNTAFTIRNSTYVPDGLVNLTLYYNDSVNNTGSMVVQFYEDNTGPSAAVGLTNSTSGKYSQSSAQVVSVSVTDALQTNASITLNYTSFTTGSPVWTIKTMTGVPGTTTVYTTTIDTTDNYHSTGDKINYYIIGTDNATNSISVAVGGSTASPLGTLNMTDNYCANNGTAPTFCYPLDVSLSAWWSVSLPPGGIMNGYSSLGGNLTTPKVLNSIAGKYKIVYYYNDTQWQSYDPSVSWSQNDLKYMNNTNGGKVYWFNMTASGAILIA